MIPSPERLSKSAWNAGGHQGPLNIKIIKSIVCVSERCPDDAFPPEPPTDICQEVRNRGEKEKKKRYSNPLK